MKFPLSMLRDLVETRLDAEALGDLLTMAGFELEEIEEVEGEPVLDINIMSNRGDAASVFGLAREVLVADREARPTALYQRLAARVPFGDEDQEAVRDLASVRVECDTCTRYACRVFEGVVNGPSPDWVQERLRKSGQRPISLLVDLTNYVMLEMGQPLHAFDLDKLPGGEIVVRRARPGEKLTTLDGIERTLRPSHMMICDATRPIAVAGVMGGADTEVDEHTTRCLLESAHFDPLSIRRTRKALDLNTAASYRFERYVDPEGVVAALNRFSELLGQSGAGGVLDVYPAPPVREPVRVRLAKVSALLGVEVPEAEAQRGLSMLGFSLLTTEDGWLVTPPSWRPDVVREEDLVEEIARAYGYDHIPASPVEGKTTEGGPHGVLALVDGLREAALRCGFDQVMSHTLRDRHPLDRTADRVLLRATPSPDAALLRNALLPGLADAASRNGGRDLHLFEIGRTFDQQGEEFLETRRMALLSQGALESAHPADPTPRQADFLSLKGVVESLATSVARPLEYQNGDDPRLHPTRQALLICSGCSVGILGQIHPKVAAEANLPPSTFLVELDLDTWLTQPATPPRPARLSRNPAVRRDIAILVPKSVAYAQIEHAIAQAIPEVLERQWLFDVYEGKGIEPGFHSLAIALQLRAYGANLTDDEANAHRDAAVRALASLGAQQR